MKPRQSTQQIVKRLRRISRWLDEKTAEASFEPPWKSRSNAVTLAADRLEELLHGEQAEVEQGGPNPLHGGGDQSGDPKIAGVADGGNHTTGGDQASVHRESPAEAPPHVGQSPSGYLITHEGNVGEETGGKRLGERRYWLGIYAKESQLAMIDLVLRNMMTAFPGFDYDVEWDVIVEEEGEDGEEATHGSDQDPVTAEDRGSPQTADGNVGSAGIGDGDSEGDEPVRG